MSYQSGVNLEAVDKPTLRRAIAEYPKCWPPVYPAFLYVFSKSGASVRLFNIICFCGTLSLILLFMWTYFPQISPFIPVMLVALVHGNYRNLYQQTSEALFLFFAAVLLLLLAWFKRQPTWLLACCLGLITAVEVLTRFFTLFWIFPIVCAHVTILNSCRSWRRRAEHMFSYIVPVLLLSLPWFLYVHKCTGFLSGMSRTLPRSLPPEVAYYKDLTVFSTNVKFALKTVFIDFFSPQRTANHQVIILGGISELETYVLIIFLSLAVLALTGFIQLLRKQAGLGHSILSANAIRSPQSLPIQFAAVYFVAIVAVWTVTNNDPIYTRFLFPAYPFLILAVVATFIWLRRSGLGYLALAPWYLGACLLTVVNLLNFGLG